MAPFHKQFNGRVMLRDICNVANIRIPDLPFLSGFMRDGQNKLCYNHMLGSCSHKECGFIHTAAKEMYEKFAQALCSAIRPGEDWLVRNGIPAPGNGKRKR